MQIFRVAFPFDGIPQIEHVDAKNSPFGTSLFSPYFLDSISKILVLGRPFLLSPFHIILVDDTPATKPSVGKTFCMNRPHHFSIFEFIQGEWRSKDLKWLTPKPTLPFVFSPRVSGTLLKQIFAIIRFPDHLAPTGCWMSFWSMFCVCFKIPVDSNYLA